MGNSRVIDQGQEELIGGYTNNEEMIKFLQGIPLIVFGIQKPSQILFHLILFQC